MLCISVAPVSRKLAKADLLNAAGQCDLIELCLDHLLKEPDVGEMLQGIPKPIVVACRRPQDGGKFDGTDEERMTLLRQAIVAGPQYVELDLETAPKVPRFGKTKRLISVMSLNGPPDDVDAAYDEAAKANADVIKFAWPASDVRGRLALVEDHFAKAADSHGRSGDRPCRPDARPTGPRARRSLELRGPRTRARIGSRPADRE